MKSKKAYIKSDGTIGEKEQSAIEYNDKYHMTIQQNQLEAFNELLVKMNAQKIIIKKTDKNINRH